MDHSDHGETIEIAMVGDLTDWENELSSRLLDVHPGGECTLFIDSPGGSPYSGLSLMSLILLRGIRATGIVTGECSSAALWPFAACRRRIVTPYSVLLFHPMKWQSEEHVGLAEAAEWARPFRPVGNRNGPGAWRACSTFPRTRCPAGFDRAYISGRELAEAGMAEMAELKSLKLFERNGASPGTSERRPCVSDGRVRRYRARCLYYLAFFPFFDRRKNCNYFCRRTSNGPLDSPTIKSAVLARPQRSCSISKRSNDGGDSDARCFSLFHPYRHRLENPP